MSSKEGCRFCDIWNGKYTHPEFDKPIKVSKNYISIVSIGAFIDGWCLIIPKEHIYSMRTLYDQQAFSDFLTSVTKQIKKTYDKHIIVFEHGANRCDSETSCGTHHAHTHVLPYGKSLLPIIQEDRDWVKVTYDKIETTVGNSEYLLYSDLSDRWENSEIYIHILQKEESQYFRRILAKDSNRNIADYSYKTSPFIKNTIKSYQALKED